MPGDSRLRNKVHQAIALRAVRLLVAQFSRMIASSRVLFGWREVRCSQKSAA
jgi:hypothetical protein